MNDDLRRKPCHPGLNEEGRTSTERKYAPHTGVMLDSESRFVRNREHGRANFGRILQGEWAQPHLWITGSGNNQILQICLQI
jgi:hypothetical protein